MDESLLYITFEEFVGMIDWSLDEEEERAAKRALWEASVLARHYGTDWSPATVPAIVKALIFRAVRRHLLNREGFTREDVPGGGGINRPDDAGVHIADVVFTFDEQMMLRELAGRPSLAAVPVQEIDVTARGIGYVPVQDGQRPFPFFADPRGPW